MPRSLVLSNRSLYLAYDDQYLVRDLFWPQVGYPNHLLGKMIRTGLWTGGQLYWLNDEGWDREIRYRNGSLVGESVFRHRFTGAVLKIVEAVHPSCPLWVREVSLDGGNQDAKLFVSHGLEIGQSDVGNTAFYHPGADAVLHYRGPYVAGFTGWSDDAQGLSDFTTGISWFGDLEGTFRDAEDGVLAKNPIAQGSVDSTLAVRLPAKLVGCFGSLIDDVVGLLERAGPLSDETVHRAEEESRRVCTGFANPVDVLTIWSNTDASGALIAANDADILTTNRATYSYCWPRDAALAALTLLKAGQTELPVEIMGFLAGLVTPDRPFFLQKYRPDGCVGASWHPWVREGKLVVPCQEDETALTVVLSAELQRRGLESHWDTSGRDMAQYLLDHRGEDGLPLPSWDLWEERYGVHAFTVLSVIKALESAAIVEGEEFARAARAMQTAFESQFWHEGLGRYLRCLGDETPDSAVVGGMLLVGPERIQRFDQTVESLATELQVTTAPGAFARYTGDYYFRRTDDQPGNPWVISTNWFARAFMFLGDQKRAELSWKFVESVRSLAGLLPEQVSAVDLSPLSVSPLTWSHAESLETALAFAERKAPSG